jgi:hypothetical protein
MDTATASQTTVFFIDVYEALSDVRNQPAIPVRFA